MRNSILLVDDDQDHCELLRSMLVRRTGRSVSKLAPFFAGAVAGGVVNRRATRSLGEKLTAELRGRRY